MSEPKRVTRILEGLATQAIWQALVFFVSAGFLSVGAARLTKAAHMLTTSLNVFLVVTGLSGIGWAWGVMPRRAKSYAKTDILGKIVIIADPIGAMLYMNQYREAIDFPFFTIRNFSQADIELEPVDLQVGGSSRMFGMTRAQFNSAKLGKLTGQSQGTVAPYNLTAKDMGFIETTCQRPGYFDLSLSGTLRVKASGESFDVPFGLTVRAGIQRLGK